MSNKLKPCPFCGSEKVIMNREDDGEVMINPVDISYFVVCNKCCIEGPYLDSRKEAIEKWNLRQNHENWFDVKEVKPKTLERVLSVYKDNGTYIAVIARYIPPKTVESEDFFSIEAEADDEWDEEKEVYYVVEGWWEASFESDMNYKISSRCREIEYWAHLPNVEVK